MKIGILIQLLVAARLDCPHGIIAPYVLFVPTSLRCDVEPGRMEHRCELAGAMFSFPERVRINTYRHFRDGPDLVKVVARPVAQVAWWENFNLHRVEAELKAD